MVLTAVKITDPNLPEKDYENIAVLGLDQGQILIFTATSTNSSENPATTRTLIGSIQLNNGNRKTYYRHSTFIKITHASINATRSLCCFVTRSETNIFNVYVAEIGLPNGKRLFSCNLQRNSPIRAYFTSNDVILLCNRNAITLLQVAEEDDPSRKSVFPEKNVQINDCIYYQWDTIEQRLHVIKKRTSISSSVVSENGRDTFVYTSYSVNSQGQFDSTMKVDFDLKLPENSLNDLHFEILSADANLFVCWQSIMKNQAEKIDYGVISFGHGRSVHISKPLNQENSLIFQSRKVHFGLLKGDYVFASLRGEFIHLLDFNIHLNFVNNLFLPNNDNTLPYDIKYVTQRGLAANAPTIIYETKRLLAYTIELNNIELMQIISPTTIQYIIPYAFVAAKDNDLSSKILEKILFEFYNDINTKTCIKEILTGLIFNRLISERIRHYKYVLVFPATTVNHRHLNDTTVKLRPYTHYRTSGIEYCGITNVHKEFYDKLRSSFDISRKYRHRLQHSHPSMTDTDENEFSQSRRLSMIGSSKMTLEKEKRASSPRLFDFMKKREPPSPSIIIPQNENIKTLLLDPKNYHLFDNVSKSLKELHSSWDPERIQEQAFEYLLSTKIQCDHLAGSFIGLAGFRVKQTLNDIKLGNDKYRKLLVIIEKLYLAMIELGFMPTNELQEILLELSFHVMPFDQFVSAIDQNILRLTEDFVMRVINELGDDPKSYEIKEQLVLMLPNANADLHARLFSTIKNNRSKRIAAQLLIDKRYSKETVNREINASNYQATGNDKKLDEIMHMNDNNKTDATNHSRLVEPAIITFLHDYKQRGKLDEDEMELVKIGLLSLGSSDSS